MPRVSQDHLDARRRQILEGARACFARHGVEGATVVRLEEETGLSRGAIFHHFRDKDALFLAVAEEDATQMVEVVAEQGLVQVMRNLLTDADPGWLGTQLEISRRVRTDADFAAQWAVRLHAIEKASTDRLQRQLDAGVLRHDVPVPTLQRFLALLLDGLVLHLASGLPTEDLEQVLDLAESAVRSSAAESTVRQQ